MRLTLIALIFLLSSCGQKGPLYLPEETIDTTQASVVSP
ncbi:MAG: lipoprotein [Pseudomonadales bacterium]